MKLIVQEKDNLAAGWRKGDIREVDDMSADRLIERGDAKAYEPPATPTEAEPVRTIDDIVDPGVQRHKRVMSAAIVGGVDPGPMSPGAAAAVAVELDGVIGTGPTEADALEAAKTGDDKPAETPAEVKGPRGGKSTFGTAQAAPGPNPVSGVAGGGADGSGE